MKDIIGLGIDIGGTKTVLAAIDAEGCPWEKVKFNSVDLFQSGGSPEVNLARQIRAYCSSLSIPHKQLRGVVIGFPGVMDHATQAILSCPNLVELDGLPLGKLLTEDLAIPVIIENDVNLIAVGEHFRGAGKGVQDLACVMVGSGIGCGLIIQDQLYRGSDGAAGEFGHTVMVPNGLPCTCGGRGCLEMYCSGKALNRVANTILEHTTSPSSAPDAEDWRKAEAVIRAAREGNVQAREAVRSAFFYLGLGIVNLTNILNPRLVLLGGGILTGWPAGIDIVRQTVVDYGRAVVKDHLRIEPTLLNEQASFAGAFFLIRQMLR